MACRTPIVSSGITHVTLAAVMAIGVSSGLSGCMTLRLEAAEQEARVTRHIGVVHVELAAPERAVIGDLRGLGVALTPLGLAAGFTRQRFAAIGPQCRTVLWVDDASRLDADVRRQIQQLAGVCLIEAVANSSP